MRLVLLGTGSADGWPNPFCSCASCNGARREQLIRGQTGVIIDNDLLIDCGPEIPRAAERHGASLSDVRVLLFTHAHPDHVGPFALLFRHWAKRREPLHLVGPPAALALCRPWLAPGDPVTLHEVGPGDLVHLLGYRLRVLAAHHEGPEIGPAVLYDITTLDQSRVLYATDTGPLPQSAYDDLAYARFDVVLMELTFGATTDHGTDHLDWQTFPQVLAGLRDVEAVIDRTQVVAIHLSDDNLSNDVLHNRLQDWGVGLLPDGAAIVTKKDARPILSSTALPQRTLIVGGARSGKSLHAERMLASEPNVIYVATGYGESDDKAWRARIQEHRDRRPANWTTVETTDVVGVLDKASGDDVLLVDCLTLWLTRILDETKAWSGDLEAANRRIDALVAAWRATRARVVAVSNEVGGGIVPDTESGRIFRDLQGRLNARVAAESEQALLAVSGRIISLP